MKSILDGIVCGLRKLHRRIRHLLLIADVEKFLTFGYLSSVPQRQLVIGYMSYCVIGAVLLSLPFMTTINVDFIDNLLIATSAVSTTGLASVDVATAYTFSGQLLILLLIQLGGIGYMTLSSFAMYRLTHHFMGNKARAFNMQFSLPETMKPETMVSNILGFTLGIELLGAILLYISFTADGIENPLWPSVFHSISAFCTAGFSLWSDNLMQFRGNTAVNLIIMALSYAGAMGFIVMSDLWRKLTVRRHRVTFTTKIIVLITTLIALWGTLHLFLFESSFAGFSLKERLLASAFQTMSAMTTVGFNTVNIGLMVPMSLLMLTMIMYIGASPSGTGGGLKSTTLSAVIAWMKCRLGLRDDVTMLGNHIPSYRVQTALTIFIVYTVVLWGGIYCLSMAEMGNIQILPLIFEAASALGTVGLSANITPELTDAGKGVIVILMFIGRVGVLTLGNAMLMRLNHNEERKHNEDLAV